jgi:protease I
MHMSLEGKHIALFIDEMFEDLEYWYPLLRLKEAGADVITIGHKVGTFTGKHGLPGKSDKAVDDVKPADFDALVIPGGYSPDMMRRKPAMVKFVRAIYDQGKPVAAICHAGWMLASADIIKGKRVTSFHSIKDDLIHAGAEWVDEPVVVDGNIITSRNPHDLPVFCPAIIKALSQPVPKDKASVA